jgi:hypothetical protein
MPCVLVFIKEKNHFMSTTWKIITVNLCNKVVTNNKSFVREVVLSLSIHRYIYIYVCVYIYTHTHTHTHTHIHVPFLLLCRDQGLVPQFLQFEYHINCHQEYVTTHSLVLQTARIWVLSPVLVQHLPIPTSSLPSHVQLIDVPWR